MVKNTTGGSGHKKRASKNAKAPVSTRVREPKEEGEILAKVTKLLDNQWTVYIIKCFNMNKPGRSSKFNRAMRQRDECGCHVQ